MSCQISSRTDVKMLVCSKLLLASCAKRNLQLCSNKCVVLDARVLRSEKLIFPWIFNYFCFAFFKCFNI